MGGELFLPTVTMSNDHSKVVLLVSLSKRFGGADVRVLQTARGLHQRCPYAVATLGKSPLYHKLLAEGLTVLECGTNRASPGLLFSLLRFIKQNQVAVVDSHNPQSQFWGILAGWFAGVPNRICTAHSVYGKADAGFFHQLLYRFVLFQNWLLGARFIVVSPEIRDHLCSMLIPKHRITLVNNGISAPDDPRDPTLRETLAWSDKDYVIGIFGRLSPIKGHEVLFDALSQVRADRPSVRCLVVGDGPLMDQLQGSVQRLGLNGSVHFTGFRSDVASLMRSCDVICQPSFSEGLPYSVLEAAALGKPMILSAVGGMPENFSHNRTARFVEPGDAKALAEEIKWCVHNPSAMNAIGQGAKELVAERFGLERMLRETFAVYGGPAGER